MWESVRALTVSSLPSFAASVLMKTLPSFFSAEMTLVLSLNLSPCFVRDFWNCFLNNHSIQSPSNSLQRSIDYSRNLLVDANASNASQELNDSDLRSESTPYTPHLKANDATSNNHHLLWYLLQIQRSRWAHNLLLVNFDCSSWEWCHLRSCGNNDILCLHFSFTSLV